MKEFQLSSGTKINYIGPPLEAGPLPALFYFALSAEESLSLDPYNQPVQALASDELRIFSMTLPGHEEGKDKHKAIHLWAQMMLAGKYPLQESIQSICSAIDTLIEMKVIDPHHLALSGLSRGGFIATHVAARHKSVSALVGFAPLCDLAQSEEFKNHSQNAPAHFKVEVERLALWRLCEELTHLRLLRFYISNRDTRVSTDSCIHFIRELAERVEAKKARHCKVELLLTSPIGFKGHGTSPQIFQEGAQILKHHLIK